jgi:Flp pilus assembly protein TadG
MLSIAHHGICTQDSFRNLDEASAPPKKNLGASMKSRISLLLLTFAFAASSTLMAHAGCTNATIQGTFAFTIHGTILIQDGSTLLVDGLAKTTFDGKGNLTQLDAVAINGNVAAGWASNTGTYVVNPDCTGTFTVTNGNQPPVHLLMIVAQSGNTIHDMVIDPGFATTAEAERIRTPQQ